MTTAEAATSPDAEVVVERDVPLDADVPWRRLSGRMIAVDVARTLLSLAPSVVAFVLLDVPVTWGTGGPLLGVAVVGVLGAGADALRWVTTRYRLTEDHLERSTGLFVRRYRSIRRDRVRSVDTDARLRHRVAGLRVVLVGAGQQIAASESALSLDAVVRADAVVLRDALLRGDRSSDEPVAVADDEDVMARFRLWWVVYNVVGVWAFLTAGGLLWGGGWFLSAFGLDVLGRARDVVGWDGLGWTGRALLAVVVLALVGAVSLAVAYVVGYWRFELARVPGAEGTQLRTRHGLLRTREVNRDDRRLRGVMISEPLLWRWMRMADTEVVTTGLSIWSANQPASILPRGPRSVARDVASRVLAADPDPVSATVRRHPARALRRRVAWAGLASFGLAAVLTYATAISSLPVWTVWLAAGALALLVPAAWVAWRALGHAVVGSHAIVRSGLVSRRTVVLQRSAVSTVVVRESVLQRRLGLRSVVLATAAGWGGYTAADLDAADALDFAARAAPGLLDPYVEGFAARPGSDIVGS